MSALAVTGLSVDLRRRPVLDGIDVHVAPGEWVAVVGPNGAGKSTLLRAITGLVPLRAGRVELAGADAARLERRARARMLAYVPQDPVVPPGMPVADYVLLGRTAHRAALGAERAVDLDAARWALDELDLLDFAGRPLDELSGGERQRVFLARALAQEAPLLLLDEPTTALDVGHQQEVLELVDRLRTGRSLSVLASMHDLTSAGQYADRLVLLDAGRVVTAGPPAAVLTEERLAAFYGADVEVLPGPDGPVVVPRRARRPATRLPEEIVR